MINNKWMEDPVLKNISDDKLNILTHIVENSKGMDAKQLLTYFIQESNAAAGKGINFSNEETDVILNVLKENMSEEEIKRIDMVKKLTNMIAKKNKNSN